MRRLYLLLIAIATLAVGCQTDNTAENGTICDTTTLSLSLAQTRVSLGEKVGNTYPSYWNEGDRVVVNGHLSEEVVINKSEPANATFVINGGTSYPYHITYPYTPATSSERAIVEFPAEQTYTEGSFAVGSAPMCGYLERGNAKATLNHLASVLRLPVKAKKEGATLKKIVITSTSGAKLAGEFAVDCQSTTISATENSTSVITYSLPENFTLSTTNESVFYISLASVEAGNCTIEFVEDAENSMVAIWSPNKPLSKGVVREFKPIIYEAKRTFTLQPMEAEEAELTIFYKRVYGNIRYSDGSPIAGVAVSDGFQVTSTDANGYYELEGVTPQTWYIYCSLPADVEVPTNEYGQPCFFKRYPSNSAQYDFTFKKLAGGKEKEFALFALADTQPSSNNIIDRFAVQAAPEIKSYSRSLGVPCYGIVLGDIVGDHPELMPNMRDELAKSKVGMPMFAVMGNHDHIIYNQNLPVFPDERNQSFFIKIQRDFEECFGPVNYSFNRGDVHIIGMRDVKHRDNISTSNYILGFSDEQFAWLQQDLALVPKDKMVVFCVHIPIFNTGTKGDGTYRQEVLSLLDQYSEAHILSGHTHYMHPYDHTWYNTGYKIYEHCTASTRPDMTACNIHRDGTPLGYSVLHAKDNTFVDWYYKGFPYGMNSRYHQMRLYRGASIFGIEPSDSGTKGYYQLPFDGNTLLANIFSSDPSWKVKVYEDGVYTGDMKYFYNISGSEYSDLEGDGTYDNPYRVKEGLECSRDFWAIGLLFGHLGSSLGNNYNTCYTMWRYTLKNANAKSIEVRATDRFGNLYTESRIEDNSDLGYAMYDPSLNPPIE